MSTKHFVLNPGKEFIKKEDIEAIEIEKIKKGNEYVNSVEKINNLVKSTDFKIKNVEGRVVVMIDRDGKNWHTFESGHRIRRERQFDNFNRRETEPVNAIVISSDYIPKGAEILIHPNGVSEVNEITNISQMSGKLSVTDIGFYSIPEDQCFFWRNENDWKPLPPYETALRVFKPYKGFLEGIEPTKIKDTLYVTSGNLKGNVVRTDVACDYCVIFQDINGREGQLIRFRPNGDEKTGKEPEAIAILENETNQVKSGDLLIGYEISDAIQLEISDYAD